MKKQRMEKMTKKMMNYDNYKYAPVEDIIGFLDGQMEANLRLKKRYYWYIAKCLVERAERIYHLEPLDIPVEELVDETWTRVTLVMMKKFSI